jgi:hypothetical protein
MGFKVKALRSGRWRDSATRVEHDVEPGTVVEFREASDASFFVDGGAGEWFNESHDASPKPVSTDEPKPKRAKKAKANVQETSEE